MFADFGLAPKQESALIAHLDLLMRWNQKLNLTAIRDPEEAIQRHYWESLFLGTHLPAGPLKIADIGSGGGFPGFPVAVLRPDCHVTLLESHQRKAVFLREATRHMANVRVLAMRGQDVEERFDHVISRAVSFDDLKGFVRDLAPDVDLLTGAEAPPADMGFSWEAPIALPWGSQRFLRIGHRIETEPCGSRHDSGAA